MDFWFFGKNNDNLIVRLYAVFPFFYILLLSNNLAHFRCEMMCS